MPWVLVAVGPCIWGALVVSWRPADADGGGVCGAWNGLVDFWIMHGMVMDETLHVLPGGRVGELFRVCQQEVFAVYHLSRCSTDCFSLELRCCLHRAFRVVGEVSVYGLCRRPSHGGFLDQGIPEEVFRGLVCVAVGWPAFVLP